MGEHSSILSFDWYDLTAQSQHIVAQELACQWIPVHCCPAALQVLIFSQFKIMLDVLEDYLRLAGFPFERIDGSVPQREREAAINRYSKGAHTTCVGNPTMCWSSAEIERDLRRKSVDLTTRRSRQHPLRHRFAPSLLLMALVTSSNLW